MTKLTNCVHCFNFFFLKLFILLSRKIVSSDEHYLFTFISKIERFKKERRENEREEDKEKYE